MRTIRSLLAVAFVCVFANASFAGLPYFITDLGTLGGTYSSAEDVNESGQAVGYSYIAGDAAYRAFTWDAAGGMVPLPTLGGTNSYAYGLNNLGQVVGEAQVAGNSRKKAFVWDQTGGMVNLGCVNGVNRNSSAREINDAGLICGRSQIHNTWDRWHATLWDSTGPNDLGTLGGSYSYAVAINEPGKVTGSAQTWLSPTDWHPHRAFVWTEQTGMVSLGAPVGSYRSYGVDINEAGWVAGLSGREGQGVEAKDAAIWDPSGSMTYLGSLGGEESRANGINDAVQVVGGAQTTGGQMHAFLYEDAQMKDLTGLLVPGHGWDYLEHATAINNAGQIVGFGRIGGETHGFLLAPAAEVAVDIRPQHETNRLNLNSSGSLPVAILGSADLDVNEVDVDSLVLAGAAPRQRDNKGVIVGYRDVNRDGFLDLEVRFVSSELEVDVGATEAGLTGSLLDGTPILGSDSIWVLMPGDANLDGFVDGQDFSILKAHFGESHSKLHWGDFNEDGIVDGQDFSILKTYFGQSAPSAGSPVPEPAMLALLAVGGMALVGRRAGRRKGLRNLG